MPNLPRRYVVPVGAIETALHPRETIYATGVIGALNAELIVPADGASSFALDLRGTFSLTLEISGTVDGINWTPIPVRPVNQAALVYVAVVTGAVAGVWVGKTGPYRSIKARCTAYTSGSVQTSLSADNAALDDSLQGLVTPLIVTAVGASSAAVTLTLPAPGAGLRQYVTYVRLARFATAALTAAATPVTVTTSNLPGTLAFSVEADAAAQGTIARPLEQDFAYPIPASAQNTAVTIVCPTTTGVIWRVTAGYYIAP